MVLFTIPFISYSLINKNDSNDLRCSNKKNKNLISSVDIKGFLSKFMIKCFPSICVILVFHSLSLFYICRKAADNESNIYNSSLVETIVPSQNVSSFGQFQKPKKCYIFALDL